MMSHLLMSLKEVLDKTLTIVECVAGSPVCASPAMLDLNAGLKKIWKNLGIPALISERTVAWGHGDLYKEECKQFFPAIRP